MDTMELAMDSWIKCMMATFISVISNDKIKADREKDQKGKKKKAKGKINIAAGKDVDADWDDRHGDDYW